jgi:hypothetical protein
MIFTSFNALYTRFKKRKKENKEKKKGKGKGKKGRERKRKEKKRGSREIPIYRSHPSNLATK